MTNRMKWHRLIPQLGSLDECGLPSVVCSGGDESGGLFLLLASTGWLFPGRMAAGGFCGFPSWAAMHLLCFDASEEKDVHKAALFQSTLVTRPLVNYIPKLHVPSRVLHPHVSMHWNVTSRLQPTPLPVHIRVVLVPCSSPAGPRAARGAAEGESCCVCSPQTKPPRKCFTSLLQAGCVPCARLSLCCCRRNGQNLGVMERRAVLLTS